MKNKNINTQILPRNKLIPYNPKLQELARQLRNNSTFSEVLLWKLVKGKSLGYEFHRQVPLDEYIVDFFCHELMLAIEIDGSSHEYKYEYDLSRQGTLEKLGVTFIRFNDRYVKKEIDHVIRVIQERIIELENQPK